MSAAAYYSDASHLSALLNAAQHWLGTPFRHKSRVNGPRGGVDCVGLAYEVHLAAGAFEPFEIEYLPLDWHEHHEDSGILGFFSQPHVRARLRQIDRDEAPMPGDLAAVQTRRTVHHLGTIVDAPGGPRLLHVPIGGVVEAWSLARPGLSIRGLWRIMQP